MTAQEIHALSGAYAVDALDAEERARFEEHLAACADCQAEVSSLQEAASLFTEISAATPAPELRDRVLADIKTTRPLPPIGGVTELITRRRRPRWSGLVAAAAAAAVFIGGGAVAWQQIQDGSSSQTSVAEQIDQVLTARDVQHVSVDLPQGASATVFRSLAKDRAVLVTEDLSPAPSGRVYQLWLQKDGRMVPAGSLKEAGNQKVLLDGAVAGASGAGITIEPQGGSKAPTTAPIALFDFEQAT